MTLTTVDKFRVLANTKGQVDEAAAEAIFNQLPAVPPEALIGSWKGSSFDTGHPSHQGLTKINWAGKEFISFEDVNPIIVYDKAGNRVVSDNYGKARLRQLVFRDVLSTAMIYDKLPIIDSFRRVSEDIVMGAMDNKDTNEHGTYYFYLTRI